MYVYQWVRGSSFGSYSPAVVWWLAAPTLSLLLAEIKVLFDSQTRRRVVKTEEVPIPACILFHLHHLCR